MAVRQAQVALVVTDLIGEGAQAAAGDDAGVQQLERTGGGVARVGERLFAGLLALAVEGGEGIEGHVYLAAHLDHAAGEVEALAAQTQRYLVDGLGVLRHVVADGAVAARDGPFQHAVAVDQVHGDAVDLGLDDVAPLRALAEQPPDAGVELAHFLLVVRVVDAEHRREVGGAGEGIERFAADALGGAVRGDQGQVLALEALKLLHQRVEFAVGDLGLVLDVVKAVVAADRLAQVLDALLHVVGAGHGRIPHGPANHHGDTEDAENGHGEGHGSMDTDRGGLRRIAARDLG